MTEPAYTRLTVDERRAQVLAAGTAMFAQHSYEEISMRQIAEAAGISKGLLYHYFPSKADLFKAAVSEAAAELEQVIQSGGSGTPLQRLTEGLDAYLAWIDGHARAWTKLMKSAATLREAQELIEAFRERTMEMVLTELTGGHQPRPALRTAITGCFGYMDAAIVDWIEHRDLARENLRDLLVASFGAALLAAQQADPLIRLPDLS